jgi:hypothetical protein
MPSVGTVSWCASNSRTRPPEGASYVASTLSRPGATCCRSTRTPRSRKNPSRKSDIPASSTPGPASARPIGLTLGMETSCDSRRVTSSTGGGSRSGRRTPTPRCYPTRSPPSPARPGRTGTAGAGPRRPGGRRTRSPRRPRPGAAPARAPGRTARRSGRGGGRPAAPRARPSARRARRGAARPRRGPRRVAAVVRQPLVELRGVGVQHGDLGVPGRRDVHHDGRLERIRPGEVVRQVRDHRVARQVRDVGAERRHGQQVGGILHQLARWCGGRGGSRWGGGSGPGRAGRRGSPGSSARGVLE